jgi:hypothetical protein
MDMQKMTKIAVAAEYFELSHKTLYNWIQDGSLKLAKPGYVYLWEVELVQIRKQEHKSAIGREHSRFFTRDERGRFKLLSGEHNGKPYNGSH